MVGVDESVAAIDGADLPTQSSLASGVVDGTSGLVLLNLGGSSVVALMATGGDPIGHLIGGGSLVETFQLMAVRLGMWSLAMWRSMWSRIRLPLRRPSLHRSWCPTRLGARSSGNIWISWPSRIRVVQFQMSLDIGW